MLAFALLGLAGTGSASGAVLCEANESPCSSENRYDNGFGLWQTTKVNFGGSIVCSGAAMEKVTDMGGEGKAVKADMELLSLSCKEGGWGCNPVNGANLPYNTEFQGSGGNGSVALSDPVGMQMTTQCLFKTCVFFTTNKVELEFTGGNPAVMAANNIPISSSGGGCPTTMSLEFKSLAPSASMFIVDGPADPVTRLCKQNMSPCLKANRHAIGTTLEGTLEGNSVFEFLYEGKLREPACEGGALTAKTTEAGKPLIGEVSAMSFSKCGAGVCAVEAQSLPYRAEIETTTAGNGTMTLVSGGTGSPKIEVNCGKSFICIYKAASVSFTLTGSASAPKLAVSQTLEKDAASEAECGASMTWKATYKLTKPTSLFVTS